jgi:hypothetical protein
MKKKYKFVSVLGISFITLITIIVILPLLISSPNGKNFALKQINQRIPGELAVASWSLRWLGNMSIEQLTFNDINGQQLLGLSKASISRGLLKLIINHNNFGEISLIKPLISIIPSTQESSIDSHSSGSKPAGSATGGNSKKESSAPKKQENIASKKASPDKEGFTIPSISGTISIEDGVVQLLSSNAPSQVVVNDLNFKLTLAGLGNPISFKVNGNTGDSESIISGSGALTLPADSVLDVNNIYLDMMLDIKNIDINPITTIAASYTDVPHINGKLNADIAVKGTLGEGIEIKTDLSAIDLAMPEKNALFGDIKIAIDGTATKTSANINSALITSKFCNITASGSYGGTGGGEITYESDMDIATTVDFLKGMGIITNDISCAGELKIAINGISAGNLISIKQADVNITNFDLDYQGKKLKQQSVVLSAPAEINVITRQVDIPIGKLTASLGSINLNSLNVGDWANVPGSVKTELQADIDINATREALSDFIVLPDNWGILGRLKTNLKIDFTKPDNYKLKLNATTSGLKIESAEPTLVIEDSPILAIDLTTNHKFDVIDIKNLTISSEIIDLNLVAGLKKDNGKSSLSIKGALAPSMTELSRYLAAFSDIPVKFSGKKSEPFEIAANWSGAGDELKISSMNGNVGLYADTIDGFGFHVRTLTIPIVFKDDKAELKIKAKVNDGDLNFVSSIDLTGKHPTIYMPAYLVILKDVNITTEVADELLGLINPIFHGISTVNGKMSFVMNNFSWPLKEEDIMSRVFAGQIIFNDVNLAANGLLTDLLDLVKEDTRELNIGTTSIDISCANGKITSSPLHLRIKKYELILDGTVGLDNSLNYLAKVPMTETLVGRDGYKYLAGTSLDIPIGGTVNNPVLNLKSFQTAISKLIGEAATKALSGELEKQFFKLFE